MRKVDMSSRAVTARIKRVSQLRRLCLSLRKAKLMSDSKREAVSLPALPSLERTQDKAR